jgi:hypothetical protein
MTRDRLQGHLLDLLLLLYVSQIFHDFFTVVAYSLYILSALVIPFSTPFSLCEGQS